MTIVLIILQIVAPVFLLAAIGYAWVKSGWDYDVEFVTRMSMSLATPVLIFVALVKTELELTAIGNLAFASLISYTFIILLIALILKAKGLELRIFWHPLVYGNTGNLGLPLALFAFGESGLSSAVIVFAVMAILSFSIGVWMVSGGGSVLKLGREPMVWGTLLGSLFLINGWQTPIWIMNTLDLIAQLAIPLMLITLGVALAKLRITHLRMALWLSLVKLFICVAIPWVIGRWFHLDPIAFAALVIQVATPVAVTSYFLAQKYQGKADEAAGLVVVSTVMSVFYLPILLALLI